MRSFRSLWLVCLVSLPLAMPAQQIPGLSQPAPAPVAPPQQQQTQPQVVPSPATTLPLLYPGEDFQLSPGDLITVRLFGSTDYSVTGRLASDGTVQLPYIGSIQLEGKSVRDARILIADRLRQGGFYRDPEVSVQVIESTNSSVILSGELRGSIPVSGSRRLIDVISAAGGLPQQASHTIQILRFNHETGKEDTIGVNLGPDPSRSSDAAMPIYPRDIIQVSRAGVVYVIGAFKNQGSVTIDQQRPLTLMQAAALSGGVGWESRYADLRLIRTESTGERREVKVDLKKVLYGQAPDPVLQSNDIVFLPADNMKAMLKSLGVGGVIGLVSLLVSVHSF